MRNVMISIRPKWCELIASGQKTVEVRKTAPKEVPFKAYIYCTNDRKVMLERSNYDKSIYLNGNIYYPHKVDCSLNGKIIGEFICDKIIPVSCYASDTNNRILLREQPYTCLTDKQMIDYLGNGVEGKGLHISDLVIYDKPKELGEFFTKCDEDCYGCEYFDDNEDFVSLCFSEKVGYWPLKRPPQSWMYVESMEDNE